MARRSALLVAAAIGTFPAAGHGHYTERGWAYPPACCKGSNQGGDCQRIPGGTVRKGKHGFLVILGPGDHYRVTREHMFLIPYGDEIPSGDGDYHICLHPTEDHMNCFFAPPDGA
ncbi:hypothetical protein [Sinorhizobium alkalisoli]|uniref:hypothetical protein n=1 Tax=Sinorhizobium alkalisoli TaxID=1752398 RepID=UPI001CD401D1|nr:hypothetical protein [Sinorhizobium alkalisoli]